jgi:predicted RNA polymerase sigma factor
VLGLVALMELQASRTKARVDANGDPVLLLAQDRARWDRVLIGRGLTALDRADALVERGAAMGPYLLQARIAACHARARTPSDTDWTQIAALYAALMEIAPSPIVELNRAVAIGMAFGPAAGLAIVDALAGDPTLSDYHLFPSVRADLLAKVGRIDEARSELERAAALTNNARERALLLARAATCR